MPNDDKWVISSSGHHMFVGFNVRIFVSEPGFTARIHYGNKIKNIKRVCIKKHRFIFQSIVELLSMEKLDSVLVILVHNLKETVTLMTNVKKVSDVDQTIV